ncbi:LPS export ABC transporter permease LptF [Pseudoxanthomonas broegbernensis]|uniref:Lipopolysaccharide export system permease protein LptF n=1 Tax=Pseudoxanthomonas broegbernensis TaxID=83619 RepID=A0A7V8GMM1_9GAMM|nr:LPS export ABC transporter permease LptF [Pseudoxanthomonas broegbernensis]KAF1686589.1 LPS export ABC transporter permease LptF [Pseudoxanthomonas broegbernensis]MBB6063663.1 lipopolysaccharide export system permease protein [Pseudoxanthomonas broegbernensis]
MPKLDRYLLRDFVQSFLATLIVLLTVSLGGVLVDVLGEIADGGLPARLLLSQLGLQLLVYLPLVLPLALMLGLMLAVARLYRDSEMAVLNAVGVGPRRLLRPLLMTVLPVAAAVGLCSLWLGPWAQRTAARMVEQAHRSLIVAGLEPGRFTALPGGGGIVYIDGMSEDGRQLQGVFLQREREGRVDVVTARTGSLEFEGDRDRYLRLLDGHRLEGPLETGLDFRLMRYAVNEVALPDRTETRQSDDPALAPTWALLGDARPSAVAELHARLTPPLLALAFALLTVPLARSSPRQQRYGRALLGFLAYLVGVNLMFIGIRLLADGEVPRMLGLWWLTVPLLALSVWLYLRDGRLPRPRKEAA